MKLNSLVGVPISFRIELLEWFPAKLHPLCVNLEQLRLHGPVPWIHSTRVCSDSTSWEKNKNLLEDLSYSVHREIFHGKKVDYLGNQAPNTPSAPPTLIPALAHKWLCVSMMQKLAWGICFHPLRSTEISDRWGLILRVWLIIVWTIHCILLLMT